MLDKCIRSFKACLYTTQDADSFPTENFFGAFLLHQSYFSSEEVICSKWRRTVWNSIVTPVLPLWTSAAWMQTLRGIPQQRTCFIKIGIIWCLPVGCQLKSAARCMAWVDCGAVQSGSRIRRQALGAAWRRWRLLIRSHFAPKWGRNDFEMVVPDSCPNFFPIATAKVKAYLSCVRFSALELLQYSRNGRTGDEPLSRACQISGIILFVGHCNLQHAGNG